MVEDVIHPEGLIKLQQELTVNFTCKNIWAFEIWRMSFRKISQDNYQINYKERWCFFLNINQNRPLQNALNFLFFYVGTQETWLSHQKTPITSRGCYCRRSTAALQYPPVMWRTQPPMSPLQLFCKLGKCLQSTYKYSTKAWKMIAF